ncbi:MAG TPA: hypothetical protein PLX89_17215 [Verrucomicrobiota bacterium]|nr:hypothetical protein [Verrucomicrobiota bacterium]
MPNPDHEILRAALAQALPERLDNLNPRRGAVKVVTEYTRTTPQAALSQFLTLTGDGWLQDARTNRIMNTADHELANQLANLDADCAWPVIGERVSADGVRSLHLRRLGDAWLLTAFEDDASADGILLTHQLLSTDLKNYLVYRVAYRAERIGRHEELRPFASRFVGFEPIPDVARPATAAEVTTALSHA